MSKKLIVTSALFTALAIGAPTWAEAGQHVRSPGQARGQSSGQATPRTAPRAPSGGSYGHAVPRTGPPPVYGGTYRGNYRGNYRGSYRGYSSYGPYGHYYRPYYGGFSLGLYYGYPYGSYYYPGYYRGYYGGYYGSPYGYGYPPGGYVMANPGYDYGGIRIQDAPRDAQVFADGYYVGIVDDFDGTFQRLQLEPGAHRIEIRAPGLEPLDFDVNVLAGQTITYHAQMRGMRR